MNEIITIETSQVQEIASSAPISFNENVISRTKCIDYGKNLLAQIEQNGGLNDELDQQVATYITKCKKTVKKMNDKRTPVTKLFDDIRSKFTALETEVDPTKKDTLPYKLQQMRNVFAQQKHREEEERRRHQLQEQQKKAAMDKYRMDVADALNTILNIKISNVGKELQELNRSITLQNISEVANLIATYPDALDKNIFRGLSVSNPINVSIDTLDIIKRDVWDNQLPHLTEVYHNEVAAIKQSIIDLIPSKKLELEKAAKASAEEAELIKKQIAERAAQEAARIEQERIEREKKEKEQAQMAQQTKEMGNLFEQAALQAPSYQPKTSVKKKIELLDPEGILPIIQMWWLDEGRNLSIEELAKLFKKQITFCEKAANDKENPTQITSEFISYVDDVKAK